MSTLATWRSWRNEDCKMTVLVTLRAISRNREKNAGSIRDQRKRNFEERANSRDETMRMNIAARWVLLR